MEYKVHLLCLLQLAAIACISLTSGEEFLSSIVIEDTGSVLSGNELREELRTPLSATIPTHTVAQFTTLRRRRRDTEDESISLSLILFNETHSFRVSHNTGVLSPNYVLEEVGPDGVPRPVQSSLGDCYFAQEMRDEEMVTVTICDDEIEGLVVTKNHTYAFQPKKKEKGKLIIWELDNTTLPQGKVEGYNADKCSNPQPPLNGDVKWSSRSVGSTAKYICEEGHTMMGPAVVRCLKSGEWSEGTPLCVPHGPRDFAIECPLLKSPNHGQVSVNKGDVWVAVYDCNEGYSLRGSHHRYCQENGRWTGSDPHCSPATPSVNDPQEWLNQTVVEDEGNSRTKRAAVLNILNETEVIEVLVYCDLLLYRRFSSNSANLERHIMAIMKLYACVMQQRSIGLPIYVKVVRIVIETTRTQLNTTREASYLANSFCKHQMTLQQPEGSPGHFDYAVLITGREMCSIYNGICEDGTIGYAPVGGMCDPYNSCGVVEHYGLQCGFTVAHETGHALNMLHDYYGNACTYGRGYVMEASLGRGTPLYQWSTCSRQELLGFRLSGATWCIREHTPGYITPPPLPSTPYNLDYQCKKSFGEQATKCPFTVAAQPDVCKWYWCKKDNTGFCWTDYLPAIDGTPCGTNRVCIKAVCSPNVVPQAVHGNWSSWSPWSTCSRTCGGGISRRSRECNNPVPSGGGRYCVGHHIQVKLCNTQDCPGSANYRSQQCASYNKPYNGRRYSKWTIYERAPVNKCSMVCIPGSERFYVVLDPFVDGTPCPPSPNYEKAVCVHGACINVGCDGMLRGGTPDICGVCNGDNSTCMKVTKKNPFNGLRHAYNPGFTIPHGVTEIMVTENPIAPRCYLVPRYNGNRLFNDNLRLSRPGTYQAGDKAVEYQWDRSTGRDSLKIKGPLELPLFIEILCNGNGWSVSYDVMYYAPKPAPATTTTLTSTSRSTTSSTLRPTTSSTLRPTTSSTLRPTTSSTQRPTTSSTLIPTTSSTLRPTTSSTLRPTTSSTSRPTTSSTLRPTTSSTSRPTPSSTLRPTSSSTLRPTESPTTKSPTEATTSQPDCPDGCEDPAGKFCSKLSESTLNALCPTQLTMHCCYTCFCKNRGGSRK